MIHLNKIVVEGRAKLCFWIVVRMCNFRVVLLNGHFDFEIKIVWVVGSKKMSIFQWQMKSRSWSAQLRRRAIVCKPAGRRTVKRLCIRPARRRTTQCVRQNTDSAMQFVVNAAKLAVALKLIRRETKTRQHDHENQSIPDLQPEFDACENFHSMQWPWPRRVTMNSAPRFLRTFET